MTERPGLDIDGFRTALDAERAEILLSRDSASDARAPVELDQQRVGRLSRMDAMQVQAMAQALDGRRKARLARIDAALARIEQGEFGVCQGCGEDIPRKRLEIDPAAPLCVACME